ncbi:hypothetical protein CPT_Machias_270 [Staphylococcus phage Machias]|nr:hypothetical protein CPT_Machias_270 [Staphylococcus phage Machias]
MVIKINRDFKETYKKLAERFDIDTDNVVFHTDAKRVNYNLPSQNNLFSTTEVWKTPSDESKDMEENSDMNLNNLEIGDISLYNNSGKEKLDTHTIKISIDSKIYTEDEVYPLYYFFLDNVEELPIISKKTFKEIAKAFYKEYEAFSSGQRSLYINIKSEWKELTYKQFINSLEKFLLDSLKEEIVESLIKEMNKYAVKDNFI